MRSWLVATGCMVWLLGAVPGAAEEPDRAYCRSDARIERVASEPVAKPTEKAEGEPAESRTDTSSDQSVDLPPSRGAVGARMGGACKFSNLNVYVPPNRSAVGARTGGGSRGPSAPRLEVLAPDHVGLTTREQPTLVWFVSEDTDAPVEITLIADGAIEPSAVARLPGPQRAGIHRVDLSEHAARLALGTTYQWSVAMVLDANARDADIVASGAIEREAATAPLAREIAGGEPSYRVLARHGIWYDAIADLSAAIDAAPTDAALRAERAALLAQVGVHAEP